MASKYTDDASHNLPEVSPQQAQGYAYAITDSPAQSPPNSHPDVKAYYAPHAETYPEAQRPRQGWKRWWILALIGLFIAIISGLIGGFIGQSIQEVLESAPKPTASNAPVVSPLSTPSSGPSPTSLRAGSSATPTSVPDQGVVGTITVPKTGCDFPNSKDRKRVSNLTAFSRKAFTTICNSGWSGRADDIIALYTLTPSDCIEACLQFNGDPSNTRTCVGGGFIPSWVDQTVAQKALGGPPLNCYLKSGNSGIGDNDREDVGTEIVALCLDGKCNGIGTG
ncbi:hypothetical protein DE146DRAFT_774455 [Phaeosphaeria sp. MPI-PUGE-AT-0046c]|nr:hypothetical protein DE146DRAFT_774455 [Phaeosphaeria sp. MPI-PUGE-AT-0046c]